MAATRLAFSSALALILSAFVCNAQEELPNMNITMVHIQNGSGTSGCMLEDQLLRDEFLRVANGELQCVYAYRGIEEVDCNFKGETCESLQNICNNLNGRVVYSESCNEIVSQRN